MAEPSPDDAKYISRSRTETCPSENPTKSIKGFRGLVGIAIVAALVAVYVMKTPTPAVRYITMPVRRGSITAVVQATGTINPLTTVPSVRLFLEPCNIFLRTSTPRFMPVMYSHSLIPPSMTHRSPRRAATLTMPLPTFKNRSQHRCRPGQCDQAQGERRIRASQRQTHCGPYATGRHFSRSERSDAIKFRCCERVQ